MGEERVDYDDLFAKKLRGVLGSKISEYDTSTRLAIAAMVAKERDGLIRRQYERELHEATMRKLRAEADKLEIERDRMLRKGCVARWILKHVFSQ